MCRAYIVCFFCFCLSQLLFVFGFSPCSSSSSSPPLFFSFVIRLAGNTVDALARASLLYAVLHLQSPLVVVLGHEKCGAVTAALQPDEALAGAPGDIKTLVRNIQSK